MGSMQSQINYGMRSEIARGPQRASGQETNRAETLRPQRKIIRKETQKHGGVAQRRRDRRGKTIGSKRRKTEDPFFASFSAPLRLCARIFFFFFLSVSAQENCL